MTALVLILFIPFMLVLWIGFRASIPILLLLFGLPAFGLIMLASGADNHDFAVGIAFYAFCWFGWIFRRHLRQ
jgi:hypothetical protein